MSFQIKNNKATTKHIYKTLYISETLVSQIEQIAVEHDTSFNNIVVSMIEHCLKDGPG
ncbi:MAG: hypothetical protein HFF54_06780 [Lawsonibacter sp.]|nr:hypothetical protein [Lawsonibacter sp.]